MLIGEADDKAKCWRPRAGQRLAFPELGLSLDSTAARQAEPQETERTSCLAHVWHITGEV